MELFDVVDDILYKKHNGQLDVSDVSMWTVMRFISMHPDPRAKEMAIVFDRFKNSMTNQALYIGMYNYIPKLKWAKIIYIQSPKEPKINDGYALELGEK